MEAATLNPAFEESAMFENMLDLMFGGEFDAYVFDTAPTANARRLLGMSQVYSLWVDKMMKSREEAKSLRQLLSFSKKKEEADPLMDYLVDFRERMGHARELLTDPALTAFFFVTLPEALPIAVITRFLKWFQDFGIPVGGIVVNGLLPGPRPRAPEFIVNRRAMQAEHLETIWRLFDGQVRALVPLFETEIRGIDTLQPAGRGAVWLMSRRWHLTRVGPWPLTMAYMSANLLMAGSARPTLKQMRRASRTDLRNLTCWRNCGLPSAVSS